MAVMGMGLGLELPTRMPELGILRAGDQVPRKDGNGNRPNMLTKWKVTSLHQNLIENIAARYGGVCQEWVDRPKGPKQWEVYTESDSLAVLILPGEPLSSQWEQWSGGGCQRRCGGTTMDTGKPCQCLIDLERRLGPNLRERLTALELLRERMALAARGDGCKPKTRLSVVLDGIPGFGLWRVTTSSLNAAIEMPGSVMLVAGALANGWLIRADLKIIERDEMKDGKPRHYTFPQIILPEVSSGELAQAGAFGVLGAGEQVTVVAGSKAIEANTQRALSAGPSPESVAGNDASRREEAGNGRETGGIPVRSTPQPTGAPSIEALSAALTALKPVATMLACKRELEARYGFPNVPADRLADALALVVGYGTAGGATAHQEPTPTQPSPAAVSAPSAPSGAVEDEDPAGPPVAAIPLDSRGAHPSPDTGQERPSAVPDLMAQLEASLAADSPVSAGPAGVDLESADVAAMGRADVIELLRDLGESTEGTDIDCRRRLTRALVAGEEAAAAASRAVADAAPGVGEWYPMDDGPPLPVAPNGTRVEDWMLIGANAARLAADPKATAATEWAWENRTRMMSERIEFLKPTVHDAADLFGETPASEALPARVGRIHERAAAKRGGAK